MYMLCICKIAYLVGTYMSMRSSGGMGGSAPSQEPTAIAAITR